MAKKSIKSNRPPLDPERVKERRYEKDSRARKAAAFKQLKEFLFERGYENVRSETEMIIAVLEYAKSREKKSQDADDLLEKYMKEYGLE